MKIKILSFVSSFIVTGIFVGLANYLNQTYFPMPPGVSMENKEAMVLYLKYMPGDVFAITFAGMVVGAYTGGFTAVMIDGIDGGRHGLQVSLLYTFFSVIGMLMVEHPWYFWLINLFTYFTFAYIGTKGAFWLREWFERPKTMKEE